MKRRFFSAQPLTAESVIALEGDERHHARVLRVREGEEIELFDGLGGNYVAVFESADAVRIIGEAPRRDSSALVQLAMSVIQLDKFELVLQKATELGVQAFIPLLADRIEVHPERFRGKDARWQKIMFEAVKQSGRSRVPTIEGPLKFDEAITRPGSKIVFDADAIQATGEPGHPATLFIGPEGGWSERELTLARENGAVFLRLGPRRLRAETAAIAAATLFANS